MSAMQRVEKVVAGGEGGGVGTYTEYAFDAAGQVIGTQNQTAWTQELIPHPQASTPLAKYQDGDTYFVHPNLLRSSTMLTDHTGTGTQELAFYAWAQQWFTGGTIKDNRFASTRFRDVETTLDPALYRNYSSRLGRWLTPGMMKGAGSFRLALAGKRRRPPGGTNPDREASPVGARS
jgi:hypothetical protein